jgi:hypothetical protein
VFWRWVIHAVLESVFCCVMTLYLLNNFDNEYGNLESYSQLGAVAFTIVILVVNWKMAIIQNQWSLMEIGVVLLSIGSWILIAVAVSVIPFVDANFYGVR